MKIKLYFLTVTYITLKIFLPKERTLPSLSPRDLLRKDFNYEDDGNIIKLPIWKLTILQDVIDNYIEEIRKLDASLAKILKYNIIFTIIAPLLSMSIYSIYFFLVTK